MAHIIMATLFLTTVLLQMRSQGQHVITYACGAPYSGALCMQNFPEC